MKKRGARKRKKTGSYMLGTVIIVLLVTAAFFMGIVLGAKKGVAQQSKSAARKNSLSKMLAVQPVLPTANIHVPILVYHYVEFVKDPKDSIRKSLDIIPPIFEEQMKTLKNAGYNFLTAAELGQYLDGKKQLPERPIIITFDDGYGDFYTDVFPILKKYNISATAYIISGGLDRPNYMTTAQLKEVAESGLVEVGAHTVHHRNLKSIPVTEAKLEIEKSREDLENLLGIKVVSFAYPYGGFNDEVAQLVKKIGFTNAVTTKGGFIVNQENRYVLFRIHPGAAVGNALLREL